MVQKAAGGATAGKSTATGARHEELFRWTDLYSKATGVATRVIDRNGAVLFASDIGRSADFCTLAAGKRGETCAKTWLYGTYQAERFGGRYIFFCRHSLLYWTTPVALGNGVRGAVVAGPVLGVRDVGFFESEIAPASADVSTARERFVAVPYIEPGRVTALSELLFATVSTADLAIGRDYTTEKELIDQQSRIAEYIHDVKSRAGARVEERPYPIEKERELVRRVASADQEGAARLLNEILGAVFFSASYDFEAVKARTLELMVLLSRAAVEGGAATDEIFGINHEHLREIDSIHTLDALSHWLARILRRFTDCVFVLKDVKHVDVMQKSIRYIRTHYQEKLSLDAVAATVGLSPSYFSRIFKEEMGVPFTRYLNGVRIERGKELLNATRLELSDVASLVGFEDQSYFNRVFKRLTGTSPGRYRESRGRSGGGVA